jgi:RNA polymerase sigma-70 factor (ECF subfamily)
VGDGIELMQGLRRRDERALADLYDRYAGAVYALALRVTRDPATAEEISLDTFLQAWHQAERFDARHGSLASWLFNIARSRAIDRLRAGSASKRLPVAEDRPVKRVSQPEEIAELVERQLIVRHALECLQPAQRAALELAYFEGLSHSQIAARLDEPLGTIKTRIRQAMLQLRQMLGPVLTTP